jgi:DNA-binding CsgD family transcriptional regulator
MGRIHDLYGAISGSESMFKPLGLDAATEAVYYAMLTETRADMDDLADIVSLDLDHEDVRQAIDRLIELSLLHPAWKEGGRLRPVSPQVGLEALLAHQRAELAAHHQRVESVRATIGDLLADYSASPPESGRTEVEKVVDLNQIHDRVTELVNSVTKSVWSFVPDTLPSEHSPIIPKELVNRGIEIRLIYQPSVRQLPSMAAYDKQLADSGGGIRTFSALSRLCGRMAIFDGRTALIPSDRGTDGILLLHTPAVVTALCALFNQTWDQAMPLYAAPASSKANNKVAAESSVDSTWMTLTKTEQAVASLVREGLSNRQIATRLFISRHTVDFHMRRVFQKFSVRSRVKLAYLLSKVDQQKT